MKLMDKEVLNFILAHQEISLETVGQLLSKKEEEIRKMIERINSVLPEGSIKIRDNKILVSGAGIEESFDMLTLQEKSFLQEYEVELRRNLIMYRLLTHHDPSSLQQLSEQFFVSRNTAFTDIKKIKELFRHDPIQLSYSRKGGYQFKGPEMIIRNKLIQITRDLIKTVYGKTKMITFHLLSETDIHLMREKLEEIEHNIEIQLTDEQVNELPYILCAILARAKNHPIEWSFQMHRYDIRNTKEYPVIRDAFQDYPFLKEPDLIYLTLQILSSNMIESAFRLSDSDEISLAVDRFVDRLKSKLAIGFIKESDLKEKILLHIQPAIFRNLLGFQINNPLKTKFIKDHGFIYQVVSESVAPFENLIGHALSPEERVYLSMIVLGWMYQTKENAKSIFKAVVLCHNGTSISKLLLENLKEMFPDFEFIGAYSFRQFESRPIEVDFIFTTIPYKSKATTIVVPPFLEQESRQQLKKLVQKLLDLDTKKKAKGIVYAIKDFIPTDKMNLVEETVKTFFESDRKNETGEESDALGLKLTEQNISILSYEISWEEVVDTIFAPLLERNAIEPRYLQAVKSAFYKHYQTMLIGPDVYLPHARPDEGVNYPDIQIVLFKKTVMFPNHRPISLMVALAPSADNSHVLTLSKLNDIFLDSKALRQIKSAASPKELLKTIERR
ncbi:BglG family transcription antiterminator [Heyndrickxia faecalis]|mgnify:CR=1 FL=1|uniref:BglG family transcription antiterminator n=2 Tax=Heyndrickxia faecalis TaxID=2824910 RepID=UPI003D1D1EF0